MPEKAEKIRRDARVAEGSTLLMCPRFTVVRGFESLSLRFFEYFGYYRYYGYFSIFLCIIILCYYAEIVKLGNT